MTWINLTLLVAVVVLGVAIWSIKRHKDPHLVLESREPLDRLIPSLSGMSLGMAIRGNAVEIFQNGAFYDALVEDIADRAHCIELKAAQWKKRGLLHRAKDSALYLFNEVL